MWFQDFHCVLFYCYVIVILLFKHCIVCWPSAAFAYSAWFYQYIKLKSVGKDENRNNSIIFHKSSYLLVHEIYTEIQPNM